MPPAMFGLPLSPSMLALTGAVLGGLAGSYLATVLWRMPLGRSANTGRSVCDACGQPLAWPAIVPVIGIFLVGGRCRRCDAPVTRQHLVLEVACAVTGGAAFALGQPALAPLLWLLLTLAMFDARYLWLPNGLVAAAAIAALLAPPPEGAGWLERIAGAAIGFAVFWLVATGYRTLRGRVGLGGGDVKLFGAIGLWCGFAHLPIILLSACSLGIAFFLAQRARGHADADTRLPLGTFLALATVAYALITFVP